MDHVMSGGTGERGSKYNMFTWQDATTRPEIMMLKELNKAGGDLPGQEMKTHKINNNSWRVGCKHIHKQIHTRFVIIKIGSPLEQFPSSKGTKKCMRSAEFCMRTSVVNNKGLLNDWDLAHKELEDHGGSGNSERTGTWCKGCTLLFTVNYFTPISYQPLLITWAYSSRMHMITDQKALSLTFISDVPGNDLEPLV
ncbi:hypothetical protein BDN71DRAFT_1431883 [Pleurotus eryngii]|uniref:Uncharacterized protein n=1 Tax=Pleurotus eryngii TaxID=5323 RepID=A0A9P5ZXQ5_PLEER|nr:hypothetical protein BDN71DRAFT_1431883 [Pleurotus eryngii]